MTDNDPLRRRTRQACQRRRDHRANQVLFSAIARTGVIKQGAVVRTHQHSGSLADVERFNEQGTVLGAGTWWQKQRQHQKKSGPAQGQSAWQQQQQASQGGQQQNRNRRPLHHRHGSLQAGKKLEKNEQHQRCFSRQTQQETRQSARDQQQADSAEGQRNYNQADPGNGHDIGQESHQAESLEPVRADWQHGRHHACLRQQGCFPPHRATAQRRKQNEQHRYGEKRKPEAGAQRGQGVKQQYKRKSQKVGTRCANRTAQHQRCDRHTNHEYSPLR